MTRREREVLRLITRYKTYAEIASVLNVTEGAIAQTVWRIRERYRKSKRLCNAFEAAQRKAKNRRYLTV